MEKLGAQNVEVRNVDCGPINQDGPRKSPLLSNAGTSSTFGQSVDIDVFSTALLLLATGRRVDKVGLPCPCGAFTPLHISRPTAIERARPACDYHHAPLIHLLHLQCKRLETGIYMIS